MPIFCYSLNFLYSISLSWFQDGLHFGINEALFNINLGKSDSLFVADTLILSRNDAVLITFHENDIY